jgi:hypothetical protein
MDKAVLFGLVLILAFASADSAPNKQNTKLDNNIVYGKNKGVVEDQEAKNMRFGGNRVCPRPRDMWADGALRRWVQARWQKYHDWGWKYAASYFMFVEAVKEYQKEDFKDDRVLKGMAIMHDIIREDATFERLFTTLAPSNYAAKRTEMCAAAHYACGKTEPSTTMDTYFDPPRLFGIRYLKDFAETDDTVFPTDFFDFLQTPALEALFTLPTAPSVDLQAERERSFKEVFECDIIPAALLEVSSITPNIIDQPTRSTSVHKLTQMVQSHGKNRGITSQPRFSKTRAGACVQPSKLKEIKGAEAEMTLGSMLVNKFMAYFPNLAFGWKVRDFYSTAPSPEVRVDEGMRIMENFIVRDAALRNFFTVDADVRTALCTTVDYPCAEEKATRQALDVSTWVDTTTKRLKGDKANSWPSDAFNALAKQKWEALDAFVMTKKSDYEGAFDCEMPAAWPAANAQ